MVALLLNCLNKASTGIHPVGCIFVLSKFKHILPQLDTWLV